MDLIFPTNDTCKSGPTCYEQESMCFFPELNKYVTLEAIAAGHIAYIVIIFVLKMFMKNRPPMEPTFLMRMYNVIQVVLSATMTVALFPWLSYGVFNFNGQFCRSIEFWVFIHYMTKYLDMFDTVWMVLRKKDRQISFLHVYHHLTIGAIWGVLLHYGIANGTAFFGAWINSLVHTLMYFHYFITSFKINNPMKKYLTQFQMAQFATCIGQAVGAVFIETQFPAKWARLQLVYHATLLALFANFYIKSAAAAKKAKKERAAKKE